MAEDDEVSGSPDHDAEATEQTRPVLPPDPAAEPVATTATTGAPAPVMVPRWRDRVWSFRAMLAVALATLVLGGVVGGAIVAAAGDDNDDHGRFMGPGGRFERMPPGMRGPRQFHDGGPGWQWKDGPQPPGPDVTPYGAPSTQPAPPTPSQ
ncbi:MAG: hypothetical protein JF565_11625 [Propionibacteriales bacterium]|nr:hypothetical protein [Propionibacteriales bacterium]